MKKKNRVTRNEDFEKIISKKRSVANGVFVVYSNKNEEGLTRIGISVGKRLGNAVARNKVKRQLRMMLQESCNMEVPVDLIVIVRKRYHEQNYAENKMYLLDLLKKVKINKYGILKCEEIINE